MEAFSTWATSGETLATANERRTNGVAAKNFPDGDAAEASC